jgi:hypothetical protein
MVSPIRAKQLWDVRLHLDNEDDSMQKAHRNSDQEESVPLVAAIDHEHQPSSSSTHLGRKHHQQPSGTAPWYLHVQIWHLAVAMIAVFLSSSIVFARSSSSSSAWWDESTISKQQQKINVSSGPMYACPTFLPSLESVNQNTTSNQEKTNQPASLDQVSWRMAGETYKQRKKYRSRWLTKRFSSLQSGNAIFESSCGTLGLDLIMTQNILSKTLGIQSLGLYGANTMMAWSSSSSSHLPLTEEGLQKLVPLDGVSICDVDIGMSPSTFIPPQSFDAVFVSAFNGRWERVVVKPLFFQATRKFRLPFQSGACDLIHLAQFCILSPYRPRFPRMQQSTLS